VKATDKKDDDKEDESDDDDEVADLNVEEVQGNSGTLSGPIEETASNVHVTEWVF